MENKLQWLKIFIKVSIIRWYFQILQIHTYVIIIAILKRKHVVSRFPMTSSIFAPF